MITEDRKEHEEHIQEKEDAMKELSTQEFEEINVDTFQELIHSEEDRKIVEGVVEDYEYLKYTSHWAPRTIKLKDMKQLMTPELNTFHTRFKYFNYIFKTEVAKLKVKKQKLKKREALFQKIAEEGLVTPGKFFDENNRPVYKKWGNSLFMRINDPTLCMAHDYKKKIAAQFGPRCVFDFSYEKDMSKREIFAVCDQMLTSYTTNYRSEGGTHDLYFTNLNKDSILYHQLGKAMPHINHPRVMISLEERSYLDIFSRDKLVYLSPNAPDDLEFDPDSIPIVGSLVDIYTQKNASFSKARREGIRTARLPLDKYLCWGAAPKILTLNQIMGILCDLYATNGDWKTALLNHVPKRKLKSPQELEQEDEYRRKKLVFQRKNFFKIEEDTTVDFDGKIMVSGQQRIDRANVTKLFRHLSDDFKDLKVEVDVPKREGLYDDSEKIYK